MLDEKYKATEIKRYKALTRRLDLDYAVCLECVFENEARKDEGLEVDDEWIEQNRQEADMLCEILKVLEKYGFKDN